MPQERRKRPLRLIPGDKADPPPTPKSSKKPPRRLTADEVARLERERDWARAAGRALDLVDVAAGTISPRLASEQVLSLVEDLDDGAARLVAAALAVEAVWFMPTADVAPRDATAIHRRQQVVREWSWGRRRRARLAVARAARLLRERS